MDNSLNWFPSSVRGDATAPEDGYYVVGSFNGWAGPVRMEAEEPGADCSIRPSDKTDAFPDSLISLDF